VIRRLAHALVLLLAISTFQGRAAAAEIQKSGSEQFPGKFAVRFFPLGWQVGFDSRDTGGYKLAADFAGILKSLDKMTLWMGGSFAYANPSYTCGIASPGCAHGIQFGVFVRLTFEKLINIPLVPYAQAGLGVDVLAYNANNIGAGIPLILGGGVDYWLLKNLGLGMYTNFAFGGAIYPVAQTFMCGPGNSSCGGFYGYWDLGFGATFAF
jgi:hypothetical protein